MEHTYTRKKKGIHCLSEIQMWWVLCIFICYISPQESILRTTGSPWWALSKEGHEQIHSFKRFSWLLCGKGLWWSKRRSGSVIIDTGKGWMVAWIRVAEGLEQCDLIQEMLWRQSPQSLQWMEREGNEKPECLFATGTDHHLLFVPREASQMYQLT